MNSEQGTPTDSGHDPDPTADRDVHSEDQADTNLPSTTGTGPGTTASDPRSDPPSDSTADSTAGPAGSITAGQPADVTPGSPAETSPGSSTAHRRAPMKIKYTRTAGTWAAVVVAIAVLVVLLVFILQNNLPVTVTFLGLQAKLPLGVAMLMSAAVGGLLVALIGTARILQLRRHARRGH